jgi:flagellar basal body rod protein FlgC
MPLPAISSAFQQSGLALLQSAVKNAPKPPPPREVPEPPRAQTVNSALVQGKEQAYGGASLLRGTAMISGASSISQSGMSAAVQRLDAAASNTANRSTPDSQRLRVEQSESANGGVQARTVRTEERNDTEQAAVQDAIEARVAERDFQANAAAFRARNDAVGSLFNEKA